MQQRLRNAVVAVILSLSITGGCENAASFGEKWINRSNTSREMSYCEQYLMEPGRWYLLGRSKEYAIPEKVRCSLISDNLK